MTQPEDKRRAGGGGVMADGNDTIPSTYPDTSHRCLHADPSSMADVNVGGWGRGSIAFLSGEVRKTSHLDECLLYSEHRHGGVSLVRRLEMRGVL